MSEFSRRDLFKNNDRDFESQRRNRNDHSVEIRKAKKEDQLLKKRNIVLSDDFSDSSPVKETVSQSKDLSINDISKMLSSKNITQLIEAATSCRKHLSKLRNPPIDEFYNNGTIPLLVGILSSYSDDTLLFESAWALTNIASGESRHTAAVVDAGAVDVFISLMSHQSDQIAEQSIWALSNIAGDSAKYRDLIVKKGIIPIVKNCIIRFWSKTEILRHVCWLISNLFRHKSKQYPVKEIRDILPIIYNLMTQITDALCHIDLSWALTYACDGRDEIIDSIIQLQFLEVINKNLEKETELLAPSLRIIGNVVAGSNEQADAAIKCGIIKSLGMLLTHSQLKIVKETCWVISNISAGTEEQVNALMNSGIMESVLNVLKNGDYKSQKEAAWAVTNMVSSQGKTHKYYLLNINVFEAIVPLLSCDDNKIVLILLDTIRDLFACADEADQLEQCLNVFESVGGIDMVETLQNHQSGDIYNKSYDLVKDYLNGVEEDGENQAEDISKFNF